MIKVAEAVNNLLKNEIFYFNISPENIFIFNKDNNLEIKLNPFSYKFSPNEV